MLQIALQQVPIPSNVQPNDIAALIQGLNANIVFHQSELPALEVQKQNETFITLSQYKFTGIKRTLFDNGSTLNVCSIRLLDRLCVDKSQIQLNSLSLKGFDNI